MPAPSISNLLADAKGESDKQIIIARSLVARTSFQKGDKLTIGPYEITVRDYWFDDVFRSVNFYLDAARDGKSLEIINPVRFRNIPVLVVDDAGKVSEKNPMQALKDALVDFVSGRPFGKSVDSHTTDVIYGSYSGRIYYNNNGAAWSTIHDNATGTASTSSEQLAIVAYSSLWSSITRYGITFDTSGIPDGDAISSAVLTLLIGGYINNNFGGSVDIVSFAPDSSTSYASGDYIHTKWGTTVFSSAAISALTVSTAHDFTLNGDGISNINKTGNTVFGGRSSWDTSNSPPTWVASQSDIVTINGTPGNHYITIIHAAGGGTYSITPGLAYKVSTTPAAGTKGLTYLVQNHPAAKTKGLTYAVPSTPAAKMREFIYVVKRTPSAKTKALAYLARTTPSPKTKALAYKALFTPSAKTKGLLYLTRHTHAAISLGMAYMIASHKEKALVYRILTTPGAKTKGLLYLARSTPSPKTKGLSYKAAVPTPKTKSLLYKVQHGRLIWKSAVYRVLRTHAPITKGMAYSVLRPGLPFVYLVKRSIARTKGMSYTVPITPSKTKTLLYTIRTTKAPITKSLAYLTKRTPAPKAKGLAYEVTHAANIKTRSLTYKVRAVHPSLTRYLAYKVKFSPARITKGLSYKAAGHHLKTKGMAYVVSSFPRLGLRYTVATFSFGDRWFRFFPKSLSEDYDQEYEEYYVGDDGLKRIYVDPAAEAVISCVAQFRNHADLKAVEDLVGSKRTLYSEGKVFPLCSITQFEPRRVGTTWEVNITFTQGRA